MRNKNIQCKYLVLYTLKKYLWSTLSQSDYSNNNIVFTAISKLCLQGQKGGRKKDNKNSALKAANGQVNNDGDGYKGGTLLVPSEPPWACH